MERKIKILFLVGSFGLGGKERQLVELIRNLPPEKYELHIIVKCIQVFYFDQVISSLRTYTSLNRVHFKGFSSLQYFISQINIISPDIVHSWAKITSIYSILALPFSKKKYVIIDGSIRNAFFPFKLFSIQSLTRMFINRFSHFIIANSKAGLNKYRIKRKGTCIYNGFDFNRTSNLTDRNLIRSNFNLKSSYVIGMVGRFEVQKDWATFITAAKLICQHRGDVNFVCVGDGKTLAKMKNLASNNPGIQFLGRQSDIESIINCFDLGILITDPDFHAEGISNSVMEYFALGIPAIVNNNGGNNEIVEHGVSGYIINSRDFKTLAENVEFLLDNPGLRHQMGKMAKEKLENSFSIHHMVNSYNQLYSLCENRLLNKIS